MNKKSLTTAVLAGLTGIAGIVSVSNAVHVNPDGTGQVLIYPYYTTRDDNDTLISVVNTTDDVKAVKVRFIEGENSQEVLDFNIYMSPFDVWTATISDDPATGNPGFSTNDNTCTVPVNLTSNPFSNLLFAGDVRTGIDRAREGYVELIEMGVLTGALSGGAIHGAGGVPPGCAAIDAAFLPGGQFFNNIDDGLTPPSGGLFGGAIVINVPGARAFGYDAVALENFFVPVDIGGGVFVPRPSLHSFPEDLNPSLNAVFPASSNVVLATGVDPIVVNDDWTTGVNVPIQAVSATLMTDQVMNQYAAEAFIGGHTEWVITFPTKRFHSDLVAVAIPPFTTTWDGNQACEPIVFQFWNREEAQSPLGGNGVSPQPAGTGLSICHEVNVLTFNNGTPSDGPDGPVISEVLGSNLFIDFDLRTDVGFETGWAQVAFNGDSAIGAVVHQMQNDDSGNTYQGLPAAGFSVQSADNAGLNALFAAAFDHAYARSIQ